MNYLNKEISTGKKWKPADSECHENNNTQLKQPPQPDNHNTVQLHSKARCLTHLSSSVTVAAVLQVNLG